jgi:hypothetical protein
MKRIIIANLLLVYTFLNFHEALAISEEIKSKVLSRKEPVIILIIFVLFLIGFMLWIFLRKKKYSSAGWIEYKVEDGESLDSLAKKHEVDWRILAKVNKIRAPYALEIGQDILVPPVAISAEKPSSSSFEEDWEKTKAADVYVNERKNIMEEAEKKSYIKKLKTNVKNKAAEKKYIIDEISMKNEEPIIIDKAKNNDKKGDIYKKIIIILLLLILLAGLVGISSFCVAMFLKAKNELNANNRVSISSIEKSPATEEKNNKEMADANLQPEDNIKTEDSKTENDMKNEDKKPADIGVKVLNGGAAAGSAGIVKGVLIGKGYGKTEAQNAEKDIYQGVVVYYGDSLESEANEVKEILKSKYPKTEIKQALTDEEKLSEIVVILGK